ncbi:uncharacterized protein [Euwallacea fornicatus]|uniref:uncharacterized protein n=1 Tax=Euwallacea fornicatus TaxID=995702 RepID=UPI00338FF84A
MTDKDPLITIDDLPLTFTVKYLGNYPAKGLWGIKFTRKPVDYLVDQAKNLHPEIILPIVNISITEDGFTFTEVMGKVPGPSRKFSVEIISYGVQDLVYTRVFSMIIVVDDTLKSESPFICHSFLCDSKVQARRITFALATVFQHYGKKVKQQTEISGIPLKRLAIDLRTPEEQAENEMESETDA